MVVEEVDLLVEDFVWYFGLVGKVLDSDVMFEWVVEVFDWVCDGYWVVWWGWLEVLLKIVVIGICVFGFECSEYIFFEFGLMVLIGLGLFGCFCV